MKNTVDLLSEKDIIRGKFKNVRGDKFCLVGHVLDKFPKEHLIVRNVIIDVIEKELKSNRLIAEFNDDPKNKKSLIARIWNRAMYKLGYTVGNPESKPLKEEM